MTPIFSCNLLRVVLTVVLVIIHHLVLIRGVVVMMMVVMMVVVYVESTVHDVPLAIIAMSTWVIASS
jgi:hypothetical protein